MTKYSQAQRAGCALRPAAPGGTGLVLLALLVVGGLPAQAHAASSRATLQCQILDNGTPASGTVTVLSPGAKPVVRPCDGELKLRPGEVTLRLTVDGLLDAPTQTKRLHLRPGARHKVVADFASARLRVQVRRGTMPVAAGVTLRDAGGKEIGRLGPGVVVHLSPGSYQVQVTALGAPARLLRLQLHTGALRQVDVDLSQ
ncbi:MAG: hypothetical protein ACPGUV_07480 [Polyangiales bacterium]